MVESRTPEAKALLRKAYSTASQKLRENHRAEFNALHAEAAKDLNVPWEPRMSGEQRAAEQIASLLEEYPVLKESASLRERFVEQEE